MIRTILKPLSFIPALLLMYMIFSFSGQTGDVSSQLSYKVSYKIVETADYVFDGNLEDWQIDEWANKINFITRKLAHMGEYFALAVAVAFPLYVYGLHGILLMLVAGIICVGFACGDEYHQSFVAGRSPSVKDVCIDSIGVFFGIIVVRIIGWTGRKTIFKPKKEKWKKVKRKNKGKYVDEPPYDMPYRSPQGHPPYPPNGYTGGPGYYPPPNGPAPGYFPNQKQPGQSYRPDPYEWSKGAKNDFEELLDPENMNDWRIDPSDVMNNEVPPVKEDTSHFYNEDLADDWGQKQPKHEENYSNTSWQPHFDPKIPPQKSSKKKPKKKEKDWFFDL